jgi:hypothetical protein
MEPVVTELVPDPKPDEQGAGQADGEAGDVEERIAPVPACVSQSDLGIISEHDETPQKSVEPAL